MQISARNHFNVQASAPAHAGDPLIARQSGDREAPDRMGRRLAILYAANVQGGGPIKLDLRPFQVAKLDRA
jgi:hypothetical protein